MFGVAEFNHLRFLEGRWEGTGPDGSSFYEEYAFAGETAMRSTRFKDASFATADDGSEVRLEDGQVVSTWNAFSWRANELVPGRACFSPVQAPSSFCWERMSDELVHVTQRWSDEQGNPQEYVVPLRRL